jgi:meromycolic acid enoyl-[acyl-carrier-protein] reductase
MSGLLTGKRLLITGVITDRSIAFAVARVAQEQGATVVLTGYGRMSLVERIARRLPRPAPIVELDVTDGDHLGSLAHGVTEHVDGLDGVVHSIGYAPPSCLGGGFLDAPWDDVATALQISAYSLKSLTAACLPLMGPGAAVVGMDFDARWCLTDLEPAARACAALLSDWFPATTGEIVHVDGGFHAVGA